MRAGPEVYCLQVKHSIRDMSRGQYQILYYPQLATAHKVDIKYNGLTVADSPIVLHAKNPGEISDGRKVLVVSC